MHFEFPSGQSVAVQGLFIIGQTKHILGNDGE